MKSPLPGMVPYLERQWQDVHARLILYACDQLEEQLPANLIARIEERLVLETEDVDQRSVHPVVKIVERPSQGSAVAVASSRAALMEPVIVHYRSETATETFRRSNGFLWWNGKVVKGSMCCASRGST